VINYAGFVVAERILIIVSNRCQIFVGGVAGACLGAF
jgi:hypothetical protein